MRTLAGNREFAALIGGVPRVGLEKPLNLIRTRIGTCIPDFMVSVFRPGTYDLPPVDPKDPGFLQRFDPRNRAYYVVEVMGFADRKYEESKKRTHPRMRAPRKAEGRWWAESSTRPTARVSSASARC